MRSHQDIADPIFLIPMKMLRALKDQLYKLCRESIDERIEVCNRAIRDAQNSANEETKSSSGDKYETGRAMAQLEIEKNSQQLAEAMKLRTALEHIPVDQVYEVAQPGSLIVTDRGTFFIAIGLGKVQLNNDTYFIVAPFSPIGLALAGSKAGETVTFRDQAYAIQELI